MKVCTTLVHTFFTFKINNMYLTDITGENIQKPLSKGVALYAKTLYRRKDKIDFDVYLPSKGMNLQRGFVWKLYQKQNLILSILKGLYIPKISVIEHQTDEGDFISYEIIDGKQRLNAIFDFIDNVYPLVVKGKDIFFKDMPFDIQNMIQSYFIKMDIFYTTNDNMISDADKIDWFKFINFSGTPQDEKHLKKL